MNPINHPDPFERLETADRISTKPLAEVRFLRDQFRHSRRSRASDWLTHKALRAAVWFTRFEITESHLDLAAAIAIAVVLWIVFALGIRDIRGHVR